MTLEILVIAAIRIAGSLPVLRWPLAGGVLAVLVDLSDLLLRDALELGGVGDYQSLDKWLDQVCMATFLVVALRWQGPARRIAIGLFAYAFEGTRYDAGTTMGWLKASVELALQRPELGPELRTYLASLQP